MRSSVISVFSRPECLQAAMRASSGLTLFATRVVGFRARLSQITLDQVRLCVAEENTPRIAFIKVPNDEVLVLTTMGGSPQVCAGIVVPSADVVVLGPGVGTYARTDSSCQWAAIWFPVDEFARYGRALIGEDVAVIGSLCVWHPAAVARRGLRRMLVGAVHLAKAKPRLTDDMEATHGFEQQLIHAVFDCLSGPMKAAPSTGVSCEALLARLDELVATNPTEHRTVDAVSRSLKVSHRRLYRCCVEQLGMSPSAYLRLRRLHLLHDALQHARPGSLRVSDAARRCGLPWRGSVATTYRRLFGESPSATLRYPPPTGGCAGLVEPNAMPRQLAVAFA
jgi:AraC family ethanolamine operon transcriptional activator